MLRRFLPVFAGLAAVLLAAVPPALGQGRDSVRDVVQVGLFRLVSAGPVFIALEKGYFTDEKLDVDLHIFSGSIPLADAVASGELDMGLSGLSSAFFDHAAEGKIKLIAGHTLEDADNPATALIVSPVLYKAGVTSPADLAGRAIGLNGVGSLPHIMVGLLYQKLGFTDLPLKVVDREGLGFLVNSFREGHVDAIVLPDEMAHMIEKKGEARIIGYVGENLTIMGSALYARDSLITAHPEVVERFLNAYRRGLVDYHEAFFGSRENQNEVVRILHRHVMPGERPEFAYPAIIASANWLPTEGELHLESVREQMEWLQGAGFLARDVKLEDTYAPDFVRVYRGN